MIVEEAHCSVKGTAKQNAESYSVEYFRLIIIIILDTVVIIMTYYAKGSILLISGSVISSEFFESFNLKGITSGADNYERYRKTIFEERF